MSFRYFQARLAARARPSWLLAPLVAGLALAFAPPSSASEREPPLDKHKQPSTNKHAIFDDVALEELRRTLCGMGGGVPVHDVSTIEILTTPSEFHSSLIVRT